MKSFKIYIKAKSHHKFYLNYLSFFIQKWAQNVMPDVIKINQVYLRTKQEHFTLLRSPHVDKKARDQYVKITLQRLFVIKVQTPTNYHYVLLNNFLKTLKETAIGVEINVTYTHLG